MGPIFVIVIAIIDMIVVSRLSPRVAATKGLLRLGSAVIGAFVVAWLVGSAFQDASFMMSPPGPITLLGAVIGGLVGAFVGSIAAARQQSVE